MDHLALSFRLLRVAPAPSSPTRELRAHTRAPSTGRRGVVALLAARARFVQGHARASGAARVRCGPNPRSPVRVLKAAIPQLYQATMVDTGEIVAVKKVLQDKRFKNRELQVVRLATVSPLVPHVSIVAQ